MPLTLYRTENGMPPSGGKPPAPKATPNPNRRWITPDGEPPFGGLPSSQRPPPPEDLPSYPVACTYPAYYSLPYYQVPALAAPSPKPTPAPKPPKQKALTWHAPAAPAPTPTPAYTPGPRFEPPGTKLLGKYTPSFTPAANFSYIFPSAHIALQYWDDGTQPWLPDASCLVSSRLVPACMTVKDLIRQLGAPEGKKKDKARKHGITVTRLRVTRGDTSWKDFTDIELGMKEMVRWGARGDWVRGETYTLGDEKDKTLEKLGWEGTVGVAVSVW